MDDLQRLREAYEAALDEADTKRVAYHQEIRKLYMAGTPLRDIAACLGISHQRVHQIVGLEEPPPRKRRGKAAGAAGALLLLAGGFAVWKLPSKQLDSERLPLPSGQLYAWSPRPAPKSVTVPVPGATVSGHPVQAEFTVGRDGNSFDYVLRLVGITEGASGFGGGGPVRRPRTVITAFNQGELGGGWLLLIGTRRDIAGVRLERGDAPPLTLQRLHTVVGSNFFVAVFQQGDPRVLRVAFLDAKGKTLLSYRCFDSQRGPTEGCLPPTKLFG